MQNKGGFSLFILKYDFLILVKVALITKRMCDETQAGSR